MSELANLFETIERWTPETSDSPSFRLIRSLTLAFIEHVLPCWPILLPKQLQSLFQTYHDYGKLARYRYMPPDYQAFLHVLTIGHIFASFNDHSDLHQLITLLGLQDEIRPGAEAVSGTGVNCPSANVTDLQVQALRDLYLHYNVQFGRERLRTVELMELHRCQVDENWDPTEDWWTLTMMWTTFNLQREILWHVASSMPPKNLLIPDAERFIAVFGTESWDHFHFQSYQTMAGHPPPTPPSFSVHPPWYDRLGLREAIYSDLRKCATYLQSFCDPNTPTAASHEPAARRCVSAIQAYLQEIQTLQGADRLFHGRCEYQFIHCVIMASAAGLLTPPTCVDFVLKLVQFYGGKPAIHFVCPRAYDLVRRVGKAARFYGTPAEPTRCQ